MNNRPQKYILTENRKIGNTNTLKPITSGIFSVLKIIRLVEFGSGRCLPFGENIFVCAQEINKRNELLVWQGLPLQQLQLNGLQWHDERLLIGGRFNGVAHYDLKDDAKLLLFEAVGWA